MRLWLLTSVLLLSACGFHLAGSRPLPDSLKSVYIDVITPYRVSEQPVETALRTLLQRRGARVRSNPDEAGTIIRLSNLQERREVLSIGTDGKALEYHLVITARYEAFSGKTVLLPPDVLSVSRDYSFNADQVLAKEAEAARLREYIQGELAELLVLRLEAVLNRSVAEPPEAKPDVVPAS